jgi:hypothetical protein
LAVGDDGMDWAQAAATVGALTAVMGLVIGVQTFWIARALDMLRDEMQRGFAAVDRRFERVERHLDRLEGHEPPGLRRV